MSSGGLTEGRGPQLLPPPRRSELRLRWPRGPWSPQLQTELCLSRQSGLFYNCFLGAWLSLSYAGHILFLSSILRAWLASTCLSSGRPSQSGPSRSGHLMGGQGTRRWLPESLTDPCAPRAASGPWGPQQGAESRRLQAWALAFLPLDLQVSALTCPLGHLPAFLSPACPALLKQSAQSMGFHLLSPMSCPFIFVCGLVCFPPETESPWGAAWV